MHFSQQKQLLEDLFNDIVRDYMFLIEQTHIQVITGQMEGIYSWIAINYVLGRFQTNMESSKFNIIRCYNEKHRAFNLYFRINK